MKLRDRWRWMLAAGLLAPMWGCAVAPQRQASDAPRGKPGDPTFVVYYGHEPQPALWDADIAVLNADAAASWVGNFDPAAVLLGYLSLGEVHATDAGAAELARRGSQLGDNPAWPGARYVDVRDAWWRAHVVNDIAPRILERGFAGFFLDTLDSVAHVERTDPDGHAGMVDAAVELVRALRAAFPRAPIMVNRGYDLLSRIVGQVDMLLGESVHTTFDAARQRYVEVDDEGLRWQLGQIDAARALAPRLRTFSLDYWESDDARGIERIYARARANGFVPYVATIDLTRVVPRG